MENSILTRVNSDTYGNPRYVAHYLKFHSDYQTALYLARLLGGSVYRSKSYCGGFVFQSYNDCGLCMDIVCLSHIYNSIDTEIVKEYISYNPKKSLCVNLENIIKAEKSSFLVKGRLTSKICEDWLRGGPSLVNNEYFNNSIIQLLEENGIECNAIYQEKIVNIFWQSCGNALYRLCGSKL